MFINHSDAYISRFGDFHADDRCLVHNFTHCFECLVVHNIDSSNVGPPPKFESKVRCTAHGSFLARLCYNMNSTQRQVGLPLVWDYGMEEGPIEA